MTLERSHILLVAVALVAGMLIGAGLRSCIHHDQEPVVVHIHDTLSIRDTLRIEGRTQTRYITYHDTIIEHTLDTLIIRDTIHLPIQHREYADSITTDTSHIAWSVQYSGYRARIDSFGLTYRFNPKTRTETKKRGFGQFVGIGIGIGGGISVVGNTIYAAPEVGLHLTYGWGYHW